MDGNKQYVLSYLQQIEMATQSSKHNLKEMIQLV